MTRADGIFGVWDLSRGSLSKAGRTGRRATEPPMDDGRCGIAVAYVRDFGDVLVGAARSDDDSRLWLVGVEVDVVLGRGGGGIGVCCARDGARVEGPATAPMPIVAVRGKLALFVAALTVGVLDPPDCATCASSSAR